MEINRVRVEGAAELDRALAELGTVVATRLGVRAARAGANEAKRELVLSAPINPKGPTKKYWSLKGGGSGGAMYGHLRDNIRVRRARSRKTTYVGFNVTTGRAFWGYFLEFGTVKMAAQPWARPAVERARAMIVAAQIETLRKGIEREARKLARGGSRIGHNGGPAWAAGD